MGVHNHYKKPFYKKNRVERFLQNKSPKLIFFSFFCQNTTKTYQKHISDPGPFLAFDTPTHPRACPFFICFQPLAPNAKRQNKSTHLPPPLPPLPLPPPQIHEMLEIQQKTEG
jgi:hypothetical protein